MERYAARRPSSHGSDLTHERQPLQANDTGARHHHDTAAENGGKNAIRRREILLMLLVQIMEFVNRRELSARTTTSSRKTADNGTLFAVVLRVCEQRMQQLQSEVGIDTGSHFPEGSL